MRELLLAICAVREEKNLVRDVTLVNEVQEGSRVGRAGISCDHNLLGFRKAEVDCPLNQSDGLIAKPSSRSEKRNIRLLRNHAGHQLRKNFILEYREMRSGDVAHEGVMARRQLTDETFSHEFP